MREKRRKFTPEFKSEAVRLVVDTSRPIAEVAREIGVHEGTLGNWVNQYRAEHADDEPRDEDPRPGDEPVEELAGEPLRQGGEIDGLGDGRGRHRSERSVTAAGTPRAKVM